MFSLLTLKEDKS